jgi:hypothetical protein
MSPGEAIAELPCSGLQHPHRTGQSPLRDSRKSKRSLKKRSTQFVRRAHLYLGLFLFPWAILYGFTGYLFNHPIALRNPPAVPFDTDTLKGTSCESLPSPNQQAEEVVAKLNQLQQPATPYRLVGSATYSGRENAMALVKTGGEKNVSVSIHVRHLRGLVHYESNREPRAVESAPFNAGPTAGGRRGRGGAIAASSRGERSSEGVFLEDTIQQRLLETVPTVLERTGFPAGDISVTSVPELTFLVEANGRTWKTHYNQLTGGVMRWDETVRNSQYDARCYFWSKCASCSTDLWNMSKRLLWRGLT